MNASKKVATNAKTAANPMAWTDEKLAQASSLYLDQLEQDKEVANSNDFLESVAEKVGVLNARSVRAKLAKAEIYKAIDKVVARKANGKPKKIELVNAIAEKLELKGKLDSLVNANADALETLLTAINSK